jgi:hypothetical protein
MLSSEQKDANGNSISSSSSSKESDPIITQGGYTKNDQYSDFAESFKHNFKTPLNIGAYNDKEGKLVFLDKSTAQKVDPTFLVNSSSKYHGWAIDKDNDDNTVVRE